MNRIHCNSYNRICYFLLSCLLTFPSPIYSKNSVTSLRCGRLGDSVVILSKTLLLSQEYGLEFLYTPLPGLNHFFMYENEKKLTEQERKQFDNIIKVTDKDQFEKNLIESGNNLYIIDRYSKIYSKDALLKYTLEHPDFLDLLKKKLMPIKKVNKLSLPSHYISIAVHVRKGNGHDRPLFSIQQYNSLPDQRRNAKEKKRYSDKRWPTKFPPDQYYIDQIKKLSNLLGNPPLYVHIFTDDKNPDKLMKRYKKALSMNNIIFACTNKNNDLIDDLCNMMNFDCMIASSSHFSWTAKLLGNHKIVINSAHGTWNGQILHIDRTIITLFDRNKKKVEKYRFDGNISHLRDEVVEIFLRDA